MGSRGDRQCYLPRLGRRSILKIPGLNALAATGTAVAQLTVLAVFVAVGVVAVRTARRRAAAAAYA